MLQQVRFVFYLRQKIRQHPEIAIGIASQALGMIRSGEQMQLGICSGGLVHPLAVIRDDEIIICTMNKADGDIDVIT